MSDFDVQELDFERDDKTIHGQIYLPDEAQAGKRIPLVICAHGLNQSLEQCDPYARELAKRGYAAYCFDFAGTAGSRSTSQVPTMNVFTEQKDLEDVFEELSQLPYVDRNNVFLMGISLGGAVASLVATHKSNLVKGLILLYPAFNIPGEIKRLYPDLNELPESFEIFGEEVSEAFVRGVHDFDFYDVIGAYQGPVLIMHGMSDELVASGYSVRAVNIYRNANLELIGEVGHGFEGGAFKYAVKKIVGFLDEEADLPDESGLGGDLNFGGGMGMFG